MKRILPIIFGIVASYNFIRMLVHGQIYYAISAYIIIGLLFLGGVLFGLKDKETNFKINLKIVMVWLPAIFSKRLLIWCWK